MRAGLGATRSALGSRAPVHQAVPRRCTQDCGWLGFNQGSSMLSTAAPEPSSGVRALQARAAPGQTDSRGWHQQPAAGPRGWRAEEAVAPRSAYAEQWRSDGQPGVDDIPVLRPPRPRPRPEAAAAPRGWPPLRPRPELRAGRMSVSERLRLYAGDSRLSHRMPLPCAPPRFLCAC